MGIILPIILIGGGLAAIFYFRPKTQNNVTEMKYMQTKSISELENKYDIDIKEEEIAKLVTIKDVIDLLETKGVNA